MMAFIISVHRSAYCFFRKSKWRLHMHCDTWSLTLKYFSKKNPKSYHLFYHCRSIQTKLFYKFSFPCVFHNFLFQKNNKYKSQFIQKRFDKQCQLIHGEINWNITFLYLQKYIRTMIKRWNIFTLFTHQKSGDIIRIQSEYYRMQCCNIYLSYWCFYFEDANSTASSVM